MLIRSFCQQWFAAVYTAWAAADFCSLLINGFVGFQLTEDGVGRDFRGELLKGEEVGDEMMKGKVKATDVAQSWDEEKDRPDETQNANITYVYHLLVVFFFDWADFMADSSRDNLPARPFPRRVPWTVTARTSPNTPSFSQPSVSYLPTIVPRISPIHLPQRYQDSVAAYDQKLDSPGHASLSLPSVQRPVLVNPPISP